MEDGNEDLDSIARALEEARAVKDKPTMIQLRCVMLTVFLLLLPCILMWFWYLVAADAGPGPDPGPRAIFFTENPTLIVRFLIVCAIVQNHYRIYVPCGGV